MRSRFIFWLAAVVPLAMDPAWGGAVRTLQPDTPEAFADFSFRALAGIGDVTGDGAGEVLVGAYTSSGAGTFQSGAAYVFNGRSGELVRTVTSPNPESIGWFGHCVAALPDINNDGVADYAVAASPETVVEYGNGRVYLYDGATGSLLRTLVSPNPVRVGQFGIALDQVPDITGDGIPELAIGAFREFAGAAESGRGYVFNPVDGALISTLESPDPRAFDVFGVTVVGIQDLNSDGAGDVLVAATGVDTEAGTDAGAIYVMDGRTGAHLRTLLSPTGTSDGGLGFGLSALADVNGDGIQDIAAGGWQEDVNGVDKAGRVHLFSGATGELLRSLSSPSPIKQGTYGASLAGYPDLNGNGAGEVIVGAWGEAVGCVLAAGKGYLVDGLTGEILQGFVSPQPQASALFGFPVVTVPDTNGDGKPEIAVGAHLEDIDNVSDAGRVYLHYSPVAEALEAEQRLEACQGSCPGNSPDADGDGLSACVETCLGSSDATTDSDADGMADSFEALYALDLLNDDANADADGDSLSNLQEFLGKSSPVDATDPAPVFFVRIDGVDEAGAGSLDQPWRTLNFALSQVVGTEQQPVRLILLCGEYDETVQLEPWVQVEGAIDAEVSLVGSITGAEGAQLKHLKIKTTAATLLRLTGAGMRVQDVGIEGGGAGAGIVVAADAGGAVIERCTISNVGIGLEVLGEIPTVRRTIFERCGTGIALRAGAQEKRRQKAIGDASDASTGWNTFRENSGLNVENETGTSVSLQFNDWDTDDAEAIRNSISGESEIEPFLPKGSGILASALFCTVWDADSQAPISTASVSLSPSTFRPLTENVEGVYAYPALAGGNYAVTVSAAGYVAGEKDVALADGELVSLTVPLRKVATPPPPPRDCFSSKSRGTPEDLLVVLGMALALVMRKPKRS